MFQVFSLHLYHSSYIEDEVRRPVLSWTPPKVTNALWELTKEILWTRATVKSEYQKIVLIKLASLMLEAMQPKAIADIGNW